MPQDQSLWEGDCFVFDYRVAVDHELKPAKWKIDPETGDPERMSDDEIEKIADRRRSGAIFKKPYTVWGDFLAKKGHIMELRAAQNGLNIL